MISIRQVIGGLENPHSFCGEKWRFSDMGVHPTHHPNFRWDFPWNLPSSSWGTPHLWKPPNSRWCCKIEQWPASIFRVPAAICARLGSPLDLMASSTEAAPNVSKLTVLTNSYVQEISSNPARRYWIYRFWGPRGEGAVLRTREISDTQRWSLGRLLKPVANPFPRVKP